jgi:hypothetical protein
MSAEDDIEMVAAELRFDHSWGVDVDAASKTTLAHVEDEVFEVLHSERPTLYHQFVRACFVHLKPLQWVKQSSIAALVKQYKFPAQFSDFYFLLTQGKHFKHWETFTRPRNSKPGLHIRLHLCAEFYHPFVHRASPPLR